MGVPGLHRLEHLLGLEVEGLGDLVDGRNPSELGGQSRRLALDLGDALLQLARHPHRPAAVAEVALELTEDRRDGIARERHAALRVEAVERLDEPEARHLDEVVERLAIAAVARCEATRERHETLDQLLANHGVAPSGVAPQQDAFVDELLVGPGGRVFGRLVGFGHEDVDGMGRPPR